MFIELSGRRSWGEATGDHLKRAIKGLSGLIPSGVELSLHEMRVFLKVICTLPLARHRELHWDATNNFPPIGIPNDQL